MQTKMVFRNVCANTWRPRFNLKLHYASGSKTTEMDTASGHTFHMNFKSHLNQCETLSNYSIYFYRWFAIVCQRWRPAHTNTLWTPYSTQKMPERCSIVKCQYCCYNFVRDLERKQVCVCVSKSIFNMLAKNIVYRSCAGASNQRNTSGDYVKNLLYKIMLICKILLFSTQIL